MPKRPAISRDSPSFFRFPLNNARTGFVPVFLPVILIEPHRRTQDGFGIPDSRVFSTKFFIADAPKPAKVAGPFNTGLLVPSSDVFTREVSDSELATTLIDLGGLPFQDEDGNQIEFDDAKEGDTFSYGLAQNNVVADDIPFFPDANYYDLSTFLIGVEDLPAPERYLFVWEVSFFERVVSPDGEFVCISDEIQISQFRLEVAHPGEVHHEMFKKTPSLYFDQKVSSVSEQALLQFYRPFADILQDIFDESSLIKGVNHVDMIPAQLIPYLAFLIGWDLPNFPGVSDNVRRSILKNGVRLQRLKGSRLAIIELFEILGFSIDILNLWFSRDGSRLIAPGENLPEEFDNQEIEAVEVCQTDVLVADFNESGFGQLEIPLLYRPTGNITLDAWIVTDDSSTREALNDNIESIINDPNAFKTDSCPVNQDGFLIPQELLDTLPLTDTGVVSMTQVLIDETGRGTDDVQVGDEPPISAEGSFYDKNTNTIKLVFDHFLDFTPASGSLRNTRLFVFATYKRIDIIVPPILKNTRSNRFDIRILLKESRRIVTNELLEFLLNNLFKLKAFHSLLRKIIFTQELLAVYNVQDFCLGGDIQQDPNFDAGKLQVPPPNIPLDITDIECNEDVIRRGAKEEDLALREAIINGLKEEHEAWKSLDGTHQTPDDPLLEALSNLEIPLPEGTDCQFTQFGQDRVENDPDFDQDDDEDLRPKVCDDEVVPLPDNCFKGRVEDILEPIPILLLNEKWRCKPCSLGMGTGSYFTFPPTGADHLDSQGNSRFLGKKLRQYNEPVPEIFFTNRPSIFEEELKIESLIAFQRPSLCVDKDNLGFPSHRFTRMAFIEDDFTSADYFAKPWDDQFSLITCEENRVEENGLNAEVIEGTDGNEVLVFDEAPLIYFGSGIEADISSLGTHAPRDFKVTHRVFSFTEPGHPALELDSRIVITSESDLVFDSSTEFPPYFKSFNAECNTDFIDGYPADCNRFSVDLTEIDFDRGTTESGLISDGLGLPERDPATDEATALFTVGSQILVDESDITFRRFAPFRVDCDCLKFACDTGITSVTSVSELTSADSELNVPVCSIDSFLENGFFESDCDKLELIPKLILNEKFGVCSTRVDGTIEFMICLLEIDSSGNKVIPEDQFIPASGSVLFQDDYGVIYEIVWITRSDRIDMITTTKSPRVPGEEPEGFVEGDLCVGPKVFRRGVITTCRTILEFQEDGSLEVIGEGCEQEIGVFQSNFVCGDRSPEDDFCFHVDCMVLDEFVVKVTCGPRWADPGDADDICVQWSDIDATGGVTAGIEIQPFAWIDVWGPDTLDLICVPCGPFESSSSSTSSSSTSSTSSSSTSQTSSSSTSSTSSSSSSSSTSLTSSTSSSTTSVTSDSSDSSGSSTSSSSSGP